RWPATPTGTPTWTRSPKIRCGRPAAPDRCAASGFPTRRRSLSGQRLSPSMPSRSKCRRWTEASRGSGRILAGEGVEARGKAAFEFDQIVGQGHARCLHPVELIEQLEVQFVDVLRFLDGTFEERADLGLDRFERHGCLAPGFA